MQTRIKMATLAFAVMAAVDMTAAEAACNDGNNRWITVNNNSNRPVSRLYVSNPGDKDWGPNLLTKTIPPDGSVIINVDDSSCRCRMDIKAESPMGTVWERRRLDVCSQSKWNLGN